MHTTVPELEAGSRTWNKLGAHFSSVGHFLPEHGINKLEGDPKATLDLPFSSRAHFSATNHASLIYCN
jgi:hypothetical protein